ncbi:MAG: hypothetical protein K2I22_06490 [Lachnospiraceae bacterium]|nr:hypothetical protein [Lachnospiraceae bacterium]
MDNRQRENQATPQNGVINVLRICTVLLAIVSFWATAQGMSEYVFEQKWQAYMASFAIQGLLLGLNFYFPTFWRYIEEHAGSLIAKAGLVLLTGVVLFCSSWFSFVYIVGRAYRQSWDVESRLLIQSTYRQILYEADDYAESCADNLRDSLGEQILSLYERAKELEGKDIVSIQGYDWEQEEAAYTGEEFAASSEMQIVIEAMRGATAEGATSSDLELAIDVIQDIKVRLESEIASLTKRIETANDDVQRTAANLQAAQARRRNPPEGSNISTLDAAVRTAENNYLVSQEALEDLSKQYREYESALSQIGLYEISLSSVMGSSSGRMGASLRSIQQELYKDNPDLDTMEGEALIVFGQILSAAEVSAEEGADYQIMLKETYQFINDLRDYRSVRGIAVGLEALVEELQGDADAVINSEGIWKEEWSGRLNGLKSLIGSLPVNMGGAGTGTARYDKAEAEDKLDDMQRLYIAEHNAAHQAIIYLDSPYRGLAIFSIILAFLLDIAAFVTGLLIDVADRRREILLQQNRERFGEGRRSVNEKIAEDCRKYALGAEFQYMYGDGKDVSYCPIVGLNHYLYLTGDYVRENEKNTYRAIEDGEEMEIDLLNTGLLSGLYTESANEATPVLGSQALAFFATENGPKDGVYQNCSLRYDDNALLILEKSKPSAKYHYLAAIDEEVPVYQLSNGTCTVMEAHYLNGNKGELVVIALNKKGSKVIAVYIMKEGQKSLESQKEKMAEKDTKAVRLLENNEKSRL